MLLSVEQIWQQIQYAVSGKMKFIDKLIQLFMEKFDIMDYKNDY